MKVLIEYIINELSDNQEGKVWIGPDYNRILENIDRYNEFCFSYGNTNTARNGLALQV